MTDKSAAERDVITKEFGNAKKLICLFHTLQIFQREVTISKLNLKSEEVRISLEYLNKLVYAESEDNYNNILSEMKIKLPAAVMKYFFKNWEPITHEWVKCFTKYTEIFYNFTNNRLESLNAKLKSVISVYSTFNEFINKLFILIKMKRVEKQNEYSKIILKVPKELSDVNEMFYKHLTAYAYKQMKKNLQDVQLVDNPFKFNRIDERRTLCIAGKDAILVSDTDCQCSFFIAMKLPCKHILFYRKYLRIELYNESLFNIRWTRKYIEDISPMSMQAFTSTTDSSSSGLELPEVKINCNIKGKTLTSHEKFKKAQAVCLQLSSLCSEVSTAEFQDRMNILIELTDNWQNLNKIQLISVEDTQAPLEKSLQASDLDEIQSNEHKKPNNLHDSRTNNLDDEQNKLRYGLQVLTDHNYSYCDNSPALRQDGTTNLYKPEGTQKFPETLIEFQEDLQEEIVCDMNYEVVEDCVSSFHAISLPSTIKQRGRPKRRSLTAIGLPRKQRKLQ